METEMAMEATPAVRRVSRKTKPRLPIQHVFDFVSKPEGRRVPGHHFRHDTSAGPAPQIPARNGTHGPTAPAHADPDPFGTKRNQGQKRHGSYYTPDAVAGSLVNWATRHSTDRLLDPACGDGRFLTHHRNSTGVERNSEAARTAKERAPKATVYGHEFFSWASATAERFDCVVGNPPFIRYQTFKGETRKTALDFCASLGVPFSGLSSSWAPFLVAAASLLRDGGRMAFVVPAEIGHAPYAAPALEYLVTHFETVQVIAIREKIFSELSEDCWLLYAEGFGGRTEEIKFSILGSFEVSPHPPSHFLRISVKEWHNLWKKRLRPFLMPPAAREIYTELAGRRDTRRLGDLAKIGIGYVSGGNEFFHLRPSDAVRMNIPSEFLYPTVRNSRVLPQDCLTPEIVKHWYVADDPILLLRIPKRARDLPRPIRMYLDSDDGLRVRQGYKCRNRTPWYAVPDIHVPDFFLAYMCGRSPSLVHNAAGCTCTNALHAVRLKDHSQRSILIGTWGSAVTRLSCEVEGHPLGGGMLKFEPREAGAIILPTPLADLSVSKAAVEEAIAVMQFWRHC